MKTELKSKRISLFPLKMAGSGLMMVMIFALSSGQPTRLAEICNVDSTGNIKPTKMAEGWLSGDNGVYSIEEPGNNVTLLSGCLGKGVCGPFEPRLIAGHEGSQARAEFCGKHAMRLTISGVEVFRLTQASLDIYAKDTHGRLKWFYGAGLLWCCFWLLLQAVVVGRTSGAGA
jgi:hypothetical protein